MKKILAILFGAAITFQGCTQPGTKQNEQAKNDMIVGGHCEGCEAIYESPVPFDQLNETDTLPDFSDAGPRIEISGIVYQRDGKTPAKDVIIYIYHTNQEGVYPKNGNEKGWGDRHGYIRGWAKTNEKGEYKFYTLVPASYPNSNNPKHIHPVIKEPGFSDYYIDEFLFDDDPFLPENKRAKAEPRGGSGILTTYTKDGMLRAKRDIILGLHIPGYPEQ